MLFPKIKFLQKISKFTVQYQVLYCSFQQDFLWFDKNQWNKWSSLLFYYGHLVIKTSSKLKFYDPDTETQDFIELLDQSKRLTSVRDTSKVRCLTNCYWYYCTLLYLKLSPSINPFHSGTLAKSEDPDEMQHFIRVFTVCLRSKQSKGTAISLQGLAINQFRKFYWRPLIVYYRKSHTYSINGKIHG